MKLKLILIAILTIVSVNCISQTSYESGYYITTNNEKVPCLILNNDWLNNPTAISVKLTENEEPKTVSIETIKEFEIIGKNKYQKHTVNIDRSSNFLNSLDSNRNPIFKEEQLFLKVLIEGKANLYVYNANNIEKFFFSVNNAKIEQLIYKSYLSDENQVLKNNNFRQQIFTNLNCSDISINDVQNIDYKSNKLIDIFVKYNKCTNAQFTNYEVKNNKGTFNLYFKAGIKSASLDIKNSVSKLKETDFGNKVGIRVGVEAEIFLPFNNNKWAIIIEPTYQNFTAKKETTTLKSEVDYKSIEIPFGVRHYMYINQNSKLFINGFVLMDFNLNSTMKFKRQYDSTLDIKSGTNIAFGIGYNYNEKVSLEFRYHSDRDLLTNYVSWDSTYKSISFIIGYSIL
ncbi:outer membrane beta-barrel protein [Lutibacter maritimus]|uniref:Outer membrane protein beta-barrel domain-containing protein n=1 Tax=Lutibacter maritimus TaxID=593133 RepID=A0A1I6NVZ6_9FLAO|nr:outer membrane beta-barrel protein [Lutibacter maritimus]SFS32029.1 Outer membrane protein beta-barrel domain-containing protein [Lutibacter maritimus]